MFDEFLDNIRGRINQFLARDLIPEAIGFVVILLLGVAAGGILKHILTRLQNKLAPSTTNNYAPWLGKVIAIIHRTARPLAIWLVGILVVSLFKRFDLPHEILDYILPFLALWAIYRFMVGVIETWLPQNLIHMWRDQILRPTIIVLALMHVFGLLDSILAYRFTVGKDITVSIGAVIGGLIVLYIFILLGRWVKGLLRDVILPRVGADPSIIPIIATFGSYIVITIGVLAGLIVAGVDLTALAVVVGGLSVGIGFGLKELINNFISGFILLFERSLTPGDVIHTGDVYGTVKDIRLRTTHVRTSDNLELIVPNGKLLAGTLTNYSQKEGPLHKGIRIPVGATYNDDPHAVMALLRGIAEAHPNVLEEPAASVTLTNFANNAIHYELRAWVVDSGSMGRVAADLRLKVWDGFVDNNFTMTGA